MRDLYMRTGDGFLFCFSVTDKKSFEELPNFIEKIKKIMGVDKFPGLIVNVILLIIGLFRSKMLLNFQMITIFHILKQARKMI
jgi:hypothetical protein